MAYWASWQLEKSPHIRSIRPLAEFIRQLQPKHAEQLKTPSLGQREVVILARCADPKVVELLIEFLEHPLRGVRPQSHRHTKSSQYPRHFCYPVSAGDFANL